MKEIILQFAAYTSWANQKMTESILLLNPALHDQPVASSFPSLYLTLAHVLHAGTIWWQRFNPDEIEMRSASSSKLSMNELADEIRNLDKKWEEWISEASEEDLRRLLHFTTARGESFHQPIYELLMHLFNHATYHRGQLVTIMRSLGLENIPKTDFIIFVRGQ